MTAERCRDYQHLPLDNRLEVADEPSMVATERANMCSPKRHRGVHKMAAAKKADKKAPSPAKVAKLRREGATWSAVREAFGVRTGSGDFTKALNAAGYDAAGLKLDGSGPSQSKARVKRREAK